MYRSYLIDNYSIKTVLRKYTPVGCPLIYHFKYLNVLEVGICPYTTCHILNDNNSVNINVCSGIEQLPFDQGGTFCNTPWAEFLKQRRLQAEDVWPSDVVKYFIS